MIDQEFGYPSIAISRLAISKFGKQQLASWIGISRNSFDKNSRCEM